MTKTLSLFAFCGLLLSATAQAQEYGVFAGVHQTDATTDAANTSLSGQFNWKAGLSANFEMAPQVRFRTGVAYNQRHFKTTATAGNTSVKVTYKYDYIDVPANFQYNFNDMVGVFAGLVVGININDDTTAPQGSSPTANGLIPLADVGFNFYSDPIGFDLYYERGIGKFADHLKDFNTFGGNLIFWF